MEIFIAVNIVSRRIQVGLKIMRSNFSLFEYLLNAKWNK